MAELNIFTEPKPQSSQQSLRQIISGFIGGTLGGIGHVLSGHPLDTVKVRMQMLDLRFIECMRTMLKNEGPSAFFQGITSPLFSMPIINAVFMGTYDVGRWLQGVGFHDQMTITQATLAGALAGGVACILGTPMELVKCRLQMEIVPENGKRTKARHMVLQVVKEQGVRGLYRGNVVTLMREVPGSGIYFAAYEYAKMNLNSWFGENAFNPFLAGGCAGIAGIVTCYPFDAIKTRLQCDEKIYPSHKWLKDGGIISCARHVWKTEGMRGFWRGLAPSALRSVVAEAFCFFIYENVRKYLAGSENV